LFLAIVSFGIYSILYSERRELMATITLVGLILIAKLGNAIQVRIARLSVDDEIASRRQTHAKR
jgi:hypothetical protein